MLSGQPVVEKSLRSYGWQMQHLTIADKSLLIGDDVAGAIVSYAAHLGRIHSADDVTVRALGIDGEEVSLLLLLNSGVTLAAESTHSLLPEPDNRVAVAYIERRLAEFELPLE